MTYRSTYELQVDYGFALLEQLEGPKGQLQYNPQEGDDELDEVFLAGFYGGQIHPDQPGHFLVYNLDLPPDAGPTDDALIAVISEQLNSLFSGWAIDETNGKVYIVDDQGLEKIMHEQ